MTLSSRSCAHRGGITVVMVLMSAAALAHHSYAMFDRSRLLTVTGTVKELQWTNPHAWLQVIVKQPGGQYLEYGFESNGPDGLRKAGWTRHIVKAGEQVTVEYLPLRNGQPGGELASLTLPDGRKLAAGLPNFGAPGHQP